MRNVLITGGGSTVGTLFCRLALGRNAGNIRIIACDTAPFGLNLTSRNDDHYVQIPPYESADYVAAIVETCVRFDVDYFVPHMEAEAIHVLRDGRIPSNLNVPSPMAQLEVYESFREKSSFAALAAQCGVPAIQVMSRGQIRADATYVVKPNVGFGGHGIRIVDGKEAARLQENAPDNLIQELVNGPEFTVEVFSFDGQIRSVVRERRATRGGICSVARFRDIQVLHDYVAEIARTFQLPVMSNFQFIQRERTGQYLLSDVNLRVAAGTGLSQVAGWDGIGALVTIAVQEGDPWSHFPKAHPSGEAFRAYEDSFFTFT